MADSKSQARRQPNLLANSLTSASSLVLLQLLSRLFTFGLNQSLIRLVSPEVFGTATIQFELLLSTILFLSREGVRNGLLRTPSRSGEASKPNDDLVSNISLLPIYLGIPITAVSSTIYFWTLSPATRAQPFFSHSVSLYAFAAMLELFSEPLYIRALNELRVSLRVRAEGTAVVLRTISTLAILLCMGKEWSLLAFAMGQVVYGATILGTYLREYGIRMRLFPKKVTTKIRDTTQIQYFDQDLLRVSSTMTAQSFVKHFLTEGDKFIVSRVSPLRDQGGYAVASNYGSLIARIIFQPIEETSRLFFSKSLSTNAAPSSSDPSISTSLTVLHTLLLLYAHLGLILLAFAPPYVHTLFSILLPPAYLTRTSAPAILTIYLVFYLPVMSVNGLLEAFHSATASPAALRTQSSLMILFSGVFVFASWAFTRGLEWTQTGLVWANAVNLGCRAVYGWVFAKRYFDAAPAPVPAGAEKKEGLDWRKVVPPRMVLLAFAAAGVVVRWSERVNGYASWKAKIVHIAVGALSFAVCAAVCALKERSTVSNVIVIIRRRKEE
ncbi:hypothetical protein BOTBODRAFT_225166 [Botryobasidium botryosum FD-172 SS1]|uniref:Man(5)GlcNAc(2)-PP-dolichol translocation protein RFT1 n=1 Tax=Botryobasidium botryosum (strain FD-172 SS1) TaxID=930990 RepID=A0A067MQX4_BOTB1|nr:hypothetical protein BOTBODRAFT_225166 [Botryobasidium botryosum FD-172 SS1]